MSKLIRLQEHFRPEDLMVLDMVHFQCDHCKAEFLMDETGGDGKQAVTYCPFCGTYVKETGGIPF